MDSGHFVLDKAKDLLTAAILTRKFAHSALMAGEWIKTTSFFFLN